MTNLKYPPFHPASLDPAPIALSSQAFSRAFADETHLVERKTGISQRVIGRVVTAFSNTDGGVILVGVSDDGTVVGRPLTASVETDIHRAIRGVNDPGRYWIHELNVDGRPVVIIGIARKAQGFAQTSDGQVLVRRGEDSVPLLGAELTQFIIERRLVRFDESSTTVLIDETNSEVVAGVRAAFGWRTPKFRPHLRTEGLITSDEPPRCTVAGVLALTEDPATHLGKSYIEFLRFPDEGVDYDRRLEIRGPVQHQVAEATQILMDELGTDLVVSGARRIELPKIPDVVIREAISNAVAHRTYEEPGRAIRILARGDRIEIESPGGLPEPVTEDNIREMNVARNIHVIRLLRRFKLAEDSGRGIDVMIDRMAEAMLDPPTFRDLGHSVLVVLPIRGAISPEERAWIYEIESRGSIRPLDRSLLIRAARGEELTNVRVRDLLGVDSRDARASLGRLRDAGLLEQFGRRGGARYVLASIGAPPAFRVMSPAELRAVVLELAASGPITNAVVREATGVDRLAALRIFEALIDSGELIRIGHRRGTFYLRP